MRDLPGASTVVNQGGKPAAAESTLLRAQRWGFALAILFLAALILRVLGTETHSFWYDEAITAQLARASFGELMRGLQKDNGNPPLYWIAVHFWSSWFGASEIGLRSLSVLCGCLMVPVLGWLGKRLVGAPASLWAAAFLVFSPISLELATEARAYALFHMLVIASGLFFWRWLDGQRLSDLAAYVLVTTLSLYSHYFAFFLPLGHGLALLAAPEGRRRLRVWIAAMCVSGVLWLPWLPVFFDQMHTKGNLSRVAETWPLQFAATPLVFAFGRSLVWRDSDKLVLGLASIAAIVALWIPALIGLLHVRRDRVAAVFLLTGVGLPVLVPLAVALLGSPLYFTRYGAMGLPSLLLLAGAGYDQLRPRLRAGLAALTILFTAASLWGFFQRPLKDDWRAASRVVASKAAPDEPLIFDSDKEAVSFNYYAARLGDYRWQGFGLVSGIGPLGELNGVRWLDNRKVDATHRDRSAEISSNRGFWLLLCVPISSQEKYLSLFRGREFVPIESFTFHRILLIHFRRMSP